MQYYKAYEIYSKTFTYVALPFSFQDYLMTNLKEIKLYRDYGLKPCFKTSYTTDVQKAQVDGYIYLCDNDFKARFEAFKKDHPTLEFIFKKVNIPEIASPAFQKDNKILNIQDKSYTWLYP